MKYYITGFFISVALLASATHNRAGEITYRWLGGLKYEATITTYTRNCQGCADRCELPINWGDGAEDTLLRQNGPTTPQCAVARSGEVIEAGIKKNIYVGQHTYPSAGSYTLFFEDPNRNGGIANIPNSIDVPFYVQTELLILPALGPNSSPVLTNPPVEKGCINRRFEHNAGAFDPDGDSLAYRLVFSRTTNGQIINTIYDPQLVQDSVEISSNGTLFWDLPKNIGEYNFAFQIIEFRKNSNGQWIKLGAITRDMQVRIEGCENRPPEIEPAGPFCVEAGKNLNFNVRVTDNKDTIDDYVRVTAFGGPFVVNNPADRVFAVAKPPIIANFNWNTACNHIREQPYEVVFKAQDSLRDPLFKPLSDLQTVEITVVGPAPENPAAQSAGRFIDLQWDAAPCANATGYKIYRREQRFGFVPGPCETGVPAYTGYTFLTELSGLNNTQYLDTFNIKQGVEYCYMITAVYPPGIEGFASEEVCGSLPLSLPMMTQVDVRQTSDISGAMGVNWIAPPELDSALFPPPYAYNLYRADSLSGKNYTLLQNFSGLNNTGYIDTPLATQNQGYNYLVSFISGPQADSVGSANAATSVFLEVEGGDMQNTLNMNHSTPWLNESYVIYRETPTGSGVFDSVGISFAERYVDTGLVNGESYCYYVQSSGRYTASDSLPAPLLNRSQVACGKPIDTIAPCPPLLESSFRCGVDSVLTLRWNNPPDSGCASDVEFYNLFYKATAQDVYPSEPIRRNISATELSIDGSRVPKAGCYAVQAVDDADNDGSPNFSELSETVCVEPCPLIRFPNIFTPNGDGINDAFRPVDFQDLGQISIRIYNRWGREVYRSIDADDFYNKGWDGRDQNTGNEVTNGVYYYIFTFIPESLGEQSQQKIKGFVHLTR